MGNPGAGPRLVPFELPVATSMAINAATAATAIMGAANRRITYCEARIGTS